MGYGFGDLVPNVFKNSLEGCWRIISNGVILEAVSYFGAASTSIAIIIIS